jgi:hypothetical protein
MSDLPIKEPIELTDAELDIVSGGRSLPSQAGHANANAEPGLTTATTTEPQNRRVEIVFP